MNFEVENLAYMLVCMQWTVSGPRSGLPGTPPWRGALLGGSSCPQTQTGVHACVQ